MAFEVIYDYLAWTATAHPGSETGSGQKPFLAYGLETVPAEIDLPVVREFLERTGLGCGANSLHGNRMAAMGFGRGTAAR